MDCNTIGDSSKMKWDLQQPQTGEWNPEKNNWRVPAKEEFESQKRCGLSMGALSRCSQTRRNGDKL
jgi:hypothetical protein